MLSSVKRKSCQSSIKSFRKAELAPETKKNPISWCIKEVLSLYWFTELILNNPLYTNGL